MLLVSSAVALGISLFAGTGLMASMVMWLAINVLITASFRFVMLIGELNFAIAGFVGLGAYAAGASMVLFDLPFVFTLFIGAVVAGLVSLPFGYITLRAKGAYFMLISFAFTEVIRMIYTKVEIFGGNSGMVGIYVPVYLNDYYPTFVVAVVLLLLYMLYRVEKSDFGKVLVAIRNNDAIVETVGINVHLTKVLCVGISSFVAGIGGALLAYSNSVISPGDFGFLLAVYTLAYLKVGGESHIMGAVVGAVVLTLLAQAAMTLGPFEHIFYGAAIVISVLVMPNGLIGLFKGRFVKRPSADTALAGHSHKGL